MCEAGAVFWEPITVFQLLRVARGLVPVRVTVLDKKEEQDNKTEAPVTLVLHLLTCERLDLH